MFRIYAEYIDLSDTRQILLYDSNIENNYVLALKLSIEYSQSGTLEMTVTRNNHYFRMDQNKMKIVRVFNNDKEIWRGFLVKEEMDFYTNITLLFEGVLSYLDRIVSIYPKYFRDIFNTESYTNSKTFKDAMDDFFLKSSKGSTKLDPANILYNTIGIEIPEYHSGIYEYIMSHRDMYDNIELSATLLDGIKTILLNLNGGIIRPKFYENLKTWDLEYYSLLNRSSETSSSIRTIKKGDQILDFKKEKVLDNIISGVLPIGKDDLLLSGEDSPIFDNIVTEYPYGNYKNPEEKYGRYVKIFNTDDSDTYYLNMYARDYLGEHDNPIYSISIDFLDEKLFSDDYIILPGDYFYYEYDPLYFNETGAHYVYGHPSKIKVMCNSIELDLVNPANSIWRSGVQSYISSDEDTTITTNNFSSTSLDFDADDIN